MNRKLRWFLINSIVPALLWVGVVRQVAFAANLTVFVMWAHLLMGLYIFIPTVITHAMKEHRLDASLASAWKGHSVPLWLDFTYDCGIVVLLAGMGWFFCAALYTVHIILVHSSLALMRKILLRAKLRCVHLDYYSCN